MKQNTLYIKRHNGITAHRNVKSLEAARNILKKINCKPSNNHIYGIEYYYGKDDIGYEKRITETKLLGVFKKQTTERQPKIKEEL